MGHFALFGHPLGHSFSKTLFDKVFDGSHDYRLIDIETLDNLRHWVELYHLSGFNVTIPYKIKIIPLLDCLTPEAQEVGAVNCVKVGADGSLTGHNTDSAAFLESLVNSTFNPPITQLGNNAISLILGTGGAALAVAAALRHLNMPYRFVSRQLGNQVVGQSGNSVISYNEAYHILDNVSMIVNATPVGMYPSIDETPWKYPELLSDKNFIYDLIYNPSSTRFIDEAKIVGAMVKEGGEMFRIQAKLSWRFWELNE